MKQAPSLIHSTAPAILTVAGILLFPASAPAPIVQQAAERDYDLIIRERERMQKAMRPEELRRKAEEDIQRKNKEVLAKMKRPPLEFPHFARPPDPVARRALRIYLQKSTAEAAGIPAEKAVAETSSRLTLYAWLTALLIAGAVAGHFWYMRRRTQDR